jgi:glutathione reductase (NADPH)
VIGAGNTGAQLTTILRSFGAEVNLLDVADRILMPSDPDISAAVTAAFREQGVRVHTGIGGVNAITQVDGGLQLEAGDASGVFDAVIMATGWPADVEALGLERAGVQHTGRAVPADSTFRTSVPTIFSVGDVNGRDMLVQAAVFEAEAAAENAVLDTNRRTPAHILPAGGFTDPDYAGVGLTEEQARERDPECRVVSVPFSRLERAVIDDREIGFLKVIADRRGELILGAHCVGEHAVEIVQTVTTAMAAGIGPDDLAAVKFAYPTYTAIVGMAARELLRVS